MLENVIESVSRLKGMRRFEADALVVNCHHNYVRKERHYGQELWITRKGAVRAGAGEQPSLPSRYAGLFDRDEVMIAAPADARAVAELILARSTARIHGASA